MSLGNTKDQGNKGNNFPYQLRNLQLLGAIQECCASSGLSLDEVIALLTTISGDTAKLDVALSTRNAEATQLLVKNLLTTIDADTSNLDVVLSSRLADSTFTSRINTLGQKTSALSTPVVLPSDQVVNVNVTANPMATDSFGRMSSHRIK